MINGLRNNEKYRESKGFNSYYPPILDEKAKYAATFMTKSDTERAFQALMIVFLKIKEGVQSEYKILQNDIMRNHLNYMWFLTFYKSLCTLLKEGEPDKSLVEYAPKFEGKSKLEFQYPYTIENEKLVYDKYNIDEKRANDVVVGYRIKYICEGYSLDDFTDGYPVWYNFFNTTIYERYSERTNVRVRIDFKDGLLYYFVAGASDNWQQITGVPLEIDEVIKSIIFR